MIATLLSILVAAAPVAADSDLASAERAFEEADLDVALKSLDRLLGRTTDPSLVSKAQLLRGRCLGAKGRMPDAARAFAAALEADPEAQLDSTHVPPDLVKLLATQRESLTAQLSASADRDGASAFLDGKPLGPLPLKAATVPIGRHTLELKTADGQFGESREVVLKPGRLEAVNWPLRALQPAPKQPPAAVPTTATTGVSKRTIGFGVGGAGVALVAGGAVAAALASSYWDHAASTADLVTYRSERDKFDASRIAADTLLGVGAAAAIAGVILIALPERPANAPTASLSVTNGGAALVASGRF